MEVGGDGPNSTPWTLGADGDGRAAGGGRSSTTSSSRTSTGCSQRTSPCSGRSGTAIPTTRRSWSANYEFLVGPDLLAAPVTGPGTTPSVYLPPGSWVDLYTGATVQGRRAVVHAADAARRSSRSTRAPGAVVPFNLRTATGSWWGVDELDASRAAPGFLATNGAQLDLTGQPHDVQIFVPPPRRPRRVTIGGHPVAVELERRPASRRRRSACTGRSSRAAIAVSAS